MTVFVPLLSILGVSFFLSRVTSIRACSMLVVSTCLTALAMYGFAYCNCLPQGALIYTVLGIMAALMMPFYAKKNHVYSQYLTPSLCFSFLIIIVSAYLVSDYTVNIGDELNHWGPLAKLFYYNNGLIGAQDVQNSPIFHLSYPPATRCLYYFFMLTGKSFDIGKAYSAHVLFMFAPFALLLSKYSWSRWRFVGVALVIFIATILKLYNIKYGFKGSIYVDNLAGICWASILVFYLQNKDSKQAIWCLLPISAILVLIKPKLFVFSVLAMGLVLAQYLYDSFLTATTNNMPYSVRRDQWRNHLKVFASIACVLLFSYVVKFSWDYHMANIGFHYGKLSPHASYETQLGVVGMMSQILFDFSSLTISQQSIVKNFFTFNPEPGFVAYQLKVLRFILYPSLLLAVCCYTYRNNKPLRNNILCLNALLFVGSIAYIAGLLTLYVSIYPPSDFPMKRFFMVYSIGWFLVNACLLLTNMKYVKKPLPSWKRSNATALAAVLATFVTLGIGLNVQAGNIKKRGYIPQAVLAVSKKIETIVPIWEKIAIVWDSPNKWSNIYLFGTYRTSIFSYNHKTLWRSPGAPLSCDDKNVSIVKPCGMKETLAPFSYVLLIQPTTDFLDKHKNMFPLGYSHNKKPAYFYLYKQKKLLMTA